MKDTNMLYLTKAINAPFLTEEWHKKKRKLAACKRLRKMSAILLNVDMS